MIAALAKDTKPEVSVHMLPLVRMVRIRNERAAVSNQGQISLYIGSTRYRNVVLSQVYSANVLAYAQASGEHGHQTPFYSQQHGIPS